MSSSQGQSNNNNSDQYANNEYINAENDPQQQYHDEQDYENDVYQQDFHFQDDADEDLPNDIVTELRTQSQAQSNVGHEDDSVFSDVVQDAFKKYQNEQDELYAQMEECWNFMITENNSSHTPTISTESSQQSQLNPDAVEFKPSWLASPSTTANEGSFVILTSTQSEEQKKKI